MQSGETLQLTLSSGHLSKDRYWRLPKVRPKDKTCAPSFDDCAQSIRDDILGITKEQLVSDVPLAFF